MVDESTTHRPRNATPSTRDPTLDICQMSPPPSIPSSSQSDSAGKIRKKSTVTPRTFTRFFTPRSVLGNGKRVGASRQALRDITASATNKRNQSKKPLHKKDGVNVLGDDLGFKDVRVQKRKALETPDTTPNRVSLSKKSCHGSFSGHSLEFELLKELPSDSEDGCNQDGEDFNDNGIEETYARPVYAPKPLTRSRYHGPLGGVLRRELNNTLRFSQASKLGYGSSELTCTTSRHGTSEIMINGGISQYSSKDPLYDSDLVGNLHQFTWVSSLSYRQWLPYIIIDFYLLCRPLVPHILFLK